MYFLFISQDKNYDTAFQYSKFDPKGFQRVMFQRFEIQTICVGIQCASHFIEWHLSLTKRDVQHMTHFLDKLDYHHFSANSSVQISLLRLIMPLCFMPCTVYKDVSLIRTFSKNVFKVTNRHVLKDLCMHM